MKKESTMPPRPPVFTAVVFHHQGNDDDDVASMLTQPLMSFDDDDESSRQQEQAASKRPAVKAGFPRALVVGTVVGFLVQVVSLLAYRTILMRWGDDEKQLLSSLAALSGAKSEDGSGVVHILLSLLTQLDLIMYVMIWLAFTCTVTKTGMSVLRKISCTVKKDTQHTVDLSRRAFFHLGVYFLIGIVVGAFVAWTMTDYYLGFPVPFLPIASTVVFDLFLCYLMIQCYDCLGTEDDEDEIPDYDELGAETCC